MKTRVIRPIVGEFVGGEPDAIRYLQKALDNAGDRGIETLSYRDLSDNTSVSISRMDTKGEIYGVSINGRKPNLLEVVEV